MMILMPTIWWWLGQCLLGSIKTGRNMRRAYERWQVLKRHHERAALIRLAWGKLRDDALRMYQHIAFGLIGLRVFFPELLYPWKFGTLQWDTSPYRFLDIPALNGGVSLIDLTSIVPMLVVLPLTFDPVAFALILVPTLLIRVSDLSYMEGNYLVDNFKK